MHLLTLQIKRACLKHILAIFSSYVSFKQNIQQNIKKIIVFYTKNTLCHQLLSIISIKHYLKQYLTE